MFSILITKWCFNEEMRTATENNGLQGVKIQTDLFSNASPSPNSQTRRRPAVTRTIEHYFSNLYCNLALKVLSSNCKDPQSEFTETLAHKEYFRFSRLFKMETVCSPKPSPTHKIKHQALPDQDLPARSREEKLSSEILPGSLTLPVTPGTHVRSSWSGLKVQSGSRALPS